MACIWRIPLLQSRVEPPPRKGGRGVQAVHLDGGVGLVWPGLNLEDGEVGGGSEGTPQARFEHKRCQRPANKSKKSVF